MKKREEGILIYSELKNEGNFEGVKIYSVRTKKRRHKNVEKTAHVKRNDERRGRHIYSLRA